MNTYQALDPLTANLIGLGFTVLFVLVLVVIGFALRANSRGKNRYEANPLNTMYGGRTCQDSF